MCETIRLKSAHHESAAHAGQAKPGDLPGSCKRLLARLVEAVSNQGEIAPLLAGVICNESADSAKELLIAPLGPGGVVEELLGFTAPERWDGVAVVAEGCEITTSRPLCVGVAVTRDGYRVALASFEGGLPIVSESDAMGGRLIDCVLRSLKLPTPPPIESVSQFSSRVDSWEELRKLTAAGEFIVDDVPPALARWMDAGIFSRWCLERAW